jgi:hypothetical protein
LELKIDFIRALTTTPGPVHALGKVIHSGKSTAIAEGRGREAVCPLHDDLPPIPDGVALRRDAEYSP